VFDRESGRETVGGDEDQGRSDEDDSTAEFESTVLVRRRGGATLPVSLELHFDDGTVERRVWDGQERWVRYRFVRPERLLAVTLDPDHKLPLDVGILDNGRRLESDGRAAAHWGARVLFWTQQALALAGM
jgi:hypothetical protein